MKKTVFILSILISFCFNAYSQSIVIDGDAELVTGSGTDVCASVWGNISGNITGSGTQCGGVLPVELISFSAGIENSRDIKLTWITASEMNNSGFDIERQTEGNIWTKIAWISGRGNSNVQNSYNYADTKLNKGTYSYRLKQIDFNGNFEYFHLNEKIIIEEPGIFNIAQNYPNPSNPVSTIEYQIPEASKVVLTIYDAAGRKINELVNENQENGYYRVRFDGSDLASGIYFYTIQVKGYSKSYTDTKKMLLIK